MTSVDLAQAHALDAIDLDFVLGAGGAVGELERMRDEGKLRAIGFAIRGAAYPRRPVALQFPMRHPGVGTVVVGASNPREIEENVAAATFPVPDEIWAEVEERMRRRA